MDLAMELHDHLDQDFCNKIIERFESDPRKKPGMDANKIDINYKLSLDLFISSFQNWNDITEKLDELIEDGIKKYQEWLNVILPYIPIDFKKLQCRGFQIQKSGKYEWHSDECNRTEEKRVLTFIWYLNTKDQDGETDFLYKKIKPHTGKLVIFPATWDYIHRGCPTENKYIITGWIYRSVL
jgi:hypothetical protein